MRETGPVDREKIVEAYARSFIAHLHEYEAKIAGTVNKYLAAIGAPPVSSVTLWPRCSGEEDSLIAGKYDPATGRITLYNCHPNGFNLRSLGHEVVHHLQATSHPSVQVQGRDIVEAEALLFAYHERPHEKEAYNLEQKIAEELVRMSPELDRYLREASRVARLANATAEGEPELSAECTFPQLADSKAKSLATLALIWLANRSAQPVSLRLMPHPTSSDMVVVEVEESAKADIRLGVMLTLTAEVVEPALREYLRRIRSIVISSDSLKGNLEVELGPSLSLLSRRRDILLSEDSAVALDHAHKCNGKHPRWPPQD